MQNAAAEQTGEEPESAGVALDDKSPGRGDASPEAPLGDDSPVKVVKMAEDKIEETPLVQDDKEQVLKPEVLADINALWDVFKHEGTDEVDINELPIIMRALDTEPKKEEIGDLVAQADQYGEGTFTKDSLIAIMEEKLRPTDTMESLLEKFDLIDKGGSRKMPTPELKQLLMT